MTRFDGFEAASKSFALTQQQHHVAYRARDGKKRKNGLIVPKA
jgi:hypothetical protein